MSRKRHLLVVFFAVVLIASTLIGNINTAMAAGANVVTDPVLKKIIQLKLGLNASSDVTASDVSKISSIAYSGYAASTGGKIASLQGLQYATSLVVLDVTDCSVSSLIPIKGLTSLKTLVLINNPVDLRTGSVNYYIVQALKNRGCNVSYNKPGPSPYLIGLRASVGVLTPKFGAGVNSFSLVLPDSSLGDSVTIYPTKADSSAKMWINKSQMNSRRFYVGIDKTLTVTVKVTAQATSKLSKPDSKYYTITITRPSSNTYLNAIRISRGRFYPSFKKTTVSYCLSLSSKQSSVLITPTRGRSTQKIKIDGVAVNSRKITVRNGKSILVDITVIARSGATRHYYVLVTRAK